MCMSYPELEYFIDKFHTTLEDARDKSLFSHELDSLLAFPITLEPIELSDDFLGALWVPPVKIQNQLGPVEHWRAYTAFYEVDAGFNKLFGEIRNLRLGNYRGYLWLVNVDLGTVEFNCHDDPFPINGIKEQVSHDFGVSIKTG